MMYGPKRYRHATDLPSVIPVFPLTGALLLPRARLPLNIFEPRYLAMIDYAMSGSRIIGMVQPKVPNAESGRRPPILSEVGCAGRIVEYSETDDGRYVITLLGLSRFKVAGERDADTPFRQVAADYAAFPTDFDGESAPEIARDRLIGALRPYLQDREMQTDWKAIEEAPADTLVDALAMLCPFEPAEKQALLEARGLKERADALIALLEMANAASQSSGGTGPKPLN
jgi:Lon protease-like protein